MLKFDDPKGKLLHLTASEHAGDNMPAYVTTTVLRLTWPTDPMTSAGQIALTVAKYLWWSHERRER
ncbi:hypothetical protein K1W54_12585 [Micromonospora sp. CPCC 205371]|nr:hypothetical protein [Micromonospora sp. CPCC 205371]